MDMKNFKEKIAVTVSNLVGTMECVAIFFAWSMLPVFFPHLQSLVFYVSGAVLQLVLLPLIMVGQSIQGRAVELRAQQDHENILAEFAELKQMHLETQESVKELQKIEILINEIILVNRKE